VLLVILAQALPSMRYRQTVKYDHSFPTNLLGDTSAPHPGPAAKDQKPSD
jgi:hypothetical protein